MRRSLEALWYARTPMARMVAWPLTALLLPFAGVYGMVIWCRRILYRQGWFRSFKLTVPVIIVGNITAGGTGKTPVVAWLVALCQSAGFSPGVVSRGYGGLPTRLPRLVQSTDKASDVGDEPLWLRRETGVPVCVCIDRVLAGRMLAAEGVNVVIADDGLQHHRLARDVEMVVVDGERRFGNGLLLPAGPLREPVSRLKSCDLVLVNGGSASEGEHGFHSRISELRSLDGTATCTLAALRGQSVRTIAGIGNPARFHAQLTAAGIRVHPVPVPDHGKVDLTALIQASDVPLVMTAKDAVKYSPDLRELPTRCPVWVAQLMLEIPADVGAQVLARLRAPLPASGRF
ncbi:MAG: tetraacyldisaccharide 4'-kinase [Gammaproteobacteria bacterium]